MATTEQETVDQEIIEMGRRTLADNAARAELPRRLFPYALIHDAMDRDCRRLPDALARVGTRDDAAALVRWFGRFETSIVHHHEREDEVIFPALRAIDASFDDAALTGEHTELDRVMEELRDALAMLASTASASVIDERGRQRASAAASALAVLMRSHLLIEEATVFGPLAERFSDDEYAAIEREIQKGSSISAAAFELPWVLDDADPSFVAYLDGELPFPFRVANSLFWQRSYRKVAAPLLAVSR